MPKITNSISDIFVKKIVEKYTNAPITRADIVKIWLRSGGSKARESYAISLLLGRGIIVRVARDVYMCGKKELFRSLYWEIVKKLIRIHAPSGAVLGGEKALEAHMYNYSIPTTLVLYTRDTTLRVKLLDGREVHFRTLVSGEKTGKKNLFSWLCKKSDPHESLGGILVPQKEIALLEALSLRRHDIGIAEREVLAFLGEYADSLDAHILKEAVSLRYIRAVNRLRTLARDNDYQDLYKSTLDAIKMSGGGVFLTV